MIFKFNSLAFCLPSERESEGGGGGRERDSERVREREWARSTCERLWAQIGVRENDNTHSETVSRFNYSPHRKTHTHTRTHWVECGELTTQSAVRDSSHMTAFRSIFFLLTGFTTQKQMQLQNLLTYFPNCVEHNCPPFDYNCIHMFCTAAPLQRAQ